MTTPILFSPVTYKQAVSALIVIHTPDLQVLLMERTDFKDAWQSVTGSQEGDGLDDDVTEIGGCAPACPAHLRSTTALRRDMSRRT